MALAMFDMLCGNHAVWGAPERKPILIGKTYRMPDGTCRTIRIRPKFKCNTCLDTGTRIDPILHRAGFTVKDSTCPDCAHFRVMISMRSLLC